MTKRNTDFDRETVCQLDFHFDQKLLNLFIFDNEFHATTTVDEEFVIVSSIKMKATLLFSISEEQISPHIIVTNIFFN